ncbi:hypothetical protein Fmac_017756 [Flemingia macrophylla]|uniref:Uncharacterized protein n=1 Tax=Flemingia macrophylla TaxID=520843 RepID=A0ABD1M323_9FABA
MSPCSTLPTSAAPWPPSSLSCNTPPVPKIYCSISLAPALDPPPPPTPWPLFPS